MLLTDVQERQRLETLLCGYGAPTTSSSEMLERRSLLERFMGDVHYAALSPADERKIALRVGVIAVLSLALALALRTLTPLSLLVLSIAFEYLSIRRRIFTRAEAFERDYTAFLLSLASAIRTGLDPLVALVESYQLFPERSELRRELLRVRAAVEAGMAEDRIIAEFASTIRHPDVAMFRSAFLMARREGSSLGVCLERLARVTRQRQSFRRKTKAAVAMQKLSAYCIGACVVFVGFVQFAANPKGMTAVMHHPVGSKALTVAFLFVLGGLGWMMRMARTRL